MDGRTELEKLLWKVIGEPLYYCEECKKAVIVKTINEEVIIEKPCGHTDAKVIAPRKSILSGKGYAGLSLANKIKVKYQQTASSITGRNV